MSIENEIERIENNITDAYDVMEAAGAEMPTIRNSNNLTMTVSNALSGSSGQAYRKLTESLYNEAITYGTYNGKTIENGEIFTAYDGTFKKYTSEISGVTRGDTYETFGTFPDTSSTTGPGYLAYGNGILVASYTGNIPYWISSDNGQTWQKIENSNKVSNVVRFYNGYFYTSLKSNNINKLHKSEDAINWTPVSSDARFISYILNDTFVANYAYSKDYGVTWTNFPMSTSGRSDLAFNNVVDNTYFCSFTNNSTSTFHLYWTEDFTNWNDISSFADNATRVDAICKFNNTYYMWYGYDEYTSHCILVTSTDKLNWTYVATYTNWTNTLGYSGTVVLSYPNYTIQNNNSSSSTSSTPEMLEEGVVTKLSYHRGVLILNDYMYFIYGKTNNEQTFIGYPIIASYSRQCISLSYNTSGINSLIPTVEQVYNGLSTNAQSGVAVKQAVDAAVSSVYKPAGSVAFSGLPTLGASYEGYVYNINEEFTTDTNFVEGAGKTYPAGTNVVCIDVGSSTYKWDVLAGYIAPTQLSDLAVGSDTVKIDYPGHNFTTVGDVNIQNNIASGFADKTKYLYSNEPLPYTQQFELQIKLNIGTLATNRNQWFCANESNTKKAVTWGIVGNTRTQRLYVTTNGSAWANPANGTFQFQDNTDYVLKLVYDGSSYTSYYSTDDGETWTADAVISRSEPLPADRPIYLGVSEEQTNCWPGSIDLSRTFMKVNGEIVWQPLRTDKSSITLNLPTNILYNNSTGADGLSIGNFSSNTGASSIGSRATVGWVSTAVGATATASGSQSVALGTYALASNEGAVAIGGSSGSGYRAQASGSHSIAIGRNAKSTAHGAIQLGSGTNTDAGTMNVSLTTDGTNWTNYKLLDEEGTIPYDRFSKVNSTELLPQYLLSDNTITVNDSGIANGFNASNGLITPVPMNLHDANNWEIQIAFNLSYTTSNRFIGSFNNTTKSQIVFGTDQNKLICWMSSNGTSWDIIDGARGSTNLSTNTNYIARVYFTGTKYQIDLKLATATDFTNEYSVDSTTKINDPDIPMFIGFCEYSGYTHGTIDLNNTYIKVNDEIYWKPFDYKNYILSIKDLNNITYYLQNIRNSSRIDTSIIIGGQPNGASRATNLGLNTTTGPSGTAIGYGANANNYYATAVGSTSSAARSAVALGENSNAAILAVAVGSSARARQEESIQLGIGVNNTPNSVNIFDDQLLDQSHYINNDRIRINEETFLGFILGSGATYNSETKILSSNGSDNSRSVGCINQWTYTNSFEFVVKIIINNTSGLQIPVSFDPSYCSIGINQYKLFINAPGNGSDIAGTHTFSAGEEVWLKLTYDLSTYTTKGYYSNDGETWIEDVSTVVQQSPISFTDMYLARYSSTLYVDTAKLTVDGKVIWTGLKHATVLKATNTSYGLVKPDNTSITVQDGVISTDALRNTATGTDSLKVGGAEQIFTGDHATVFGVDSEADAYSTSIGYNNYSANGSVAVGTSVAAYNCTIGVGIGNNIAVDGDYSIAIGNGCTTSALGAIQIGPGINNAAGTFSVGLRTASNVSNNYQLLDSSGKIPAARIGVKPSADGTYIPALSIVDGVETITWVPYTPNT